MEKWLIGQASLFHHIYISPFFKLKTRCCKKNDKNFTGIHFSWLHFKWVKSSQCMQTITAGDVYTCVHFQCDSEQWNINAKRRRRPIDIYAAAPSIGLVASACTRLGRTRESMWARLYQRLLSPKSGIEIRRKFLRLLDSNFPLSGFFFFFSASPTSTVFSPLLFSPYATRYRNKSPCSLQLLPVTSWQVGNCLPQFLAVAKNCPKYSSRCKIIVERCKFSSYNPPFSLGLCD